MKKDRNCSGLGVQPFPYQPMMPTPMMPMNYNTQMQPQGLAQGFQSVDQRLDNIEKRLSVLEANLNNQTINSGFGSNYQII